MEPQGRPILADYCRAGFALVPIPAGLKGPTTARWNTREACIVEPALAEWLDGNIGLAHAYSGTCAIDIDDLEACTEWLAQRAIDLPALLAAPDAVCIESRPGRAKLIYRVGKPLPSFKLPCRLELRCASASGLTLQDVLPPSIHPDTRKPYTWRLGPQAHWSKPPPLPGDLAALWTGLIDSAGRKAASASKPTLRDRREMEEAAPALRLLLDGLDPDVDYDSWIEVGMALHHETQGADLGLRLWNDWSSRAKTKYKGLGDLETHWRSFRVDHSNPKTLASLRRTAVAAADEFDDVSASPASSNAAPAPVNPSAPASAPRLTGAARERALELVRTLRKNTKTGVIEARVSNVVSVLSVPEVCGFEIALDEFQDAVMIAAKGADTWRLFADTDYTQLRVWLETIGNTEPISAEMIRAAVALVADRQKLDTARLWLEALQWDGVERIGRFCTTHFGTIDTEYTRAVSLYMWSALAGRIMDPGCQCDMVPVLIGRQGVGKSRGVQALVPSPEHYVEVRLDEPDDVIARKCRGVLVGELAEMRGLRAADVERVKAFVTRTHEKWIPKYREFATNYPRRFLMIGTTNDEEFLPADNEHRRWLPLHTQRIDVQAIRNDRMQLWAEALVYYTVNGIAWDGMDRLAEPARLEASSADGWEDAVAAYIGEHTDQPLRMQDILVNGIGIDSRHVTRVQELRVARILRSLGYERKVMRQAGRNAKVWCFTAEA